uniref:UBC core domain-containing protein n=1 Tax=Acrobeloides nanus TaxID=290746 RepID=A0A914CUS4_9BILA
MCFFLKFWGTSESGFPMAENNLAFIRLKNDYKKIILDPIPNVLALPSPSSLLEWHFVLLGSIDTPYEGGYYHGKLLFPNDFPFKPPTILILTPSGRFEPNKPLCFSMSDYHPETWNPSWTVTTIIMGVISFMNDTAMTTGSL